MDRGGNVMLPQSQSSAHNSNLIITNQAITATQTQ